MKNIKILILIVVLITFAVGLWLYPIMPDQLVSHWNINGSADGYMTKFWGLFIMPIIGLIIFLAYLLIPKIDPYKENIEKFRNSFDGLILMIILFLAYIYALSIFWNLGYRFSMNRALPPALAILFCYCGVVIGKTKRNWFIGIRTPWTLSSERVWNETHQLGGKLFKIVAVIALLGVLIPKYSFYLAIIPVVIAALYTTVFSYFSYQKKS